MLSAAQLQQYEDQGYLIVEDVIDSETVLEPVVEEYSLRLTELCSNWIAEDRLDADASTSNFEACILSAYRAGLDYFQPLDISLPGGTITEETPFHAGPAVFRLLTHLKLLDIVESMIGPEITSNPIQHVRIKPPTVDLHSDESRAHITATDWHQDRGVTLEQADQTRMVTAWVAVTNATEANGCLQVIPGSHHGEMLPHCPNPQVGIPKRFLDPAKAQPLPVKAGGVVLFHPLTIHGSLANHSRGVRWSFDLRYNVTGDPTGRPIFPSFVARSRRAPETALRDPKVWHEMWEAARSRLALQETTTLHRWAPDAAHCA